MKREIFLHIGYPKTGTTTLQNYLFPAHSEICYLRDRCYHLDFISNLFYDRENAFIRKSDEIKNKLENLVMYEAKNKFVYSEESLTSFAMFFRFSPSPYVWTLEPNSIARKIKVAFKDTSVFEHTKIIITIRKQDEMLKSMYAQVYNFVFKKFKETKNFKRFLNYALYENEMGFIIDSLFYDDIIREYERLFGKENICVLVFEQMKDDIALYVKKLCDFMNIKHEEALRLINNKHMNKRSSSEGYKSDERNIIEIFSFYKNKYLGSKPLGLGNGRLNNLMKRIYIPGKKLYDIEICEREDGYLNNIFSKSNRLLSERYNLDLKKYGYYYE